MMGNTMGNTGPRISIIVAVGRNGVIGRDGALPWRLPEDLKRFKALTMGHVMIMGRKTYESIGRLLPGRRSVIVSRQAGYVVAGAIVAASLEDAIAAAGDAAEVFVIGGGEIYRAALPSAHRLLVTEVDASPEGDASFPPVDTAIWRETARENHGPGPAADAPGFAFVDYERLPAV
jgi:dihydrofolate reductase